MSLRKDLHALDIYHRTCPACSRPFKTAKGMGAHLNSAESCLWYGKGKRKELGAKSGAEQAILEAEEAQRNILEVDIAPETLATPVHDDQPLRRGAANMRNRLASEDVMDVDEDPEIVEQVFHDEMFTFIPAGLPHTAMDVDNMPPNLNEPGPSNYNQANPGPSSAGDQRPGLQLDDDDDERVIDEFPGAGRRSTLR